MAALTVWLLLPTAGAAQHWPATDPTNKAGWIPYAPLTDEFVGTTLDLTKWTTKVGWKGEIVGLFVSSAALTE